MCAAEMRAEAHAHLRVESMLLLLSDLTKETGLCQQIFSQIELSLW
jgi:hypothetical protein